MDIKGKAKKIKKDIPVVWLALRHKQTPIIAKILAAITVGYALSPIDLVPDFVPVLGYLDDVILLPVLILCTMKLIPSSVIEEYRTQAEGVWQNGRPKKWYYAIPIVVIWVVILWVIVEVAIDFVL